MTSKDKQRATVKICGKHVLSVLKSQKAYITLSISSETNYYAQREAGLGVGRGDFRNFNSMHNDRFLQNI